MASLVQRCWNGVNPRHSGICRPKYSENCRDSLCSDQYYGICLWPVLSTVQSAHVHWQALLTRGHCLWNTHQQYNTRRLWNQHHRVDYCGTFLKQYWNAHFRVEKGGHVVNTFCFYIEFKLRHRNLVVAWKSRGQSYKRVLYQDDTLNIKITVKNIF